MEPDVQTAQIIATAIEVHRHPGPGLLESIYEEAFCHEFHLRGLLINFGLPRLSSTVCNPSLFDLCALCGA